MTQNSFERCGGQYIILLVNNRELQCTWYNIFYIQERIETTEKNGALHPALRS